MGKIAPLAAYVLRATHVGILLFVLLGWLAPWPVVVQWHVIFVPLVVLQWVLNDDKCVLTQWENRLKGDSREKATESAQEAGFVESLIFFFFKKKPSRGQLQAGIWIGTWSCWLGGAIRLFLSWKWGHSGT